MSQLYYETRTHVELLKEIMDVVTTVAIQQLYTGSLFPEISMKQAKTIEIVLRSFNSSLVNHAIRSIDFTLLSPSAIKIRQHSYSNSPTITPEDLFRDSERRRVNNNNNNNTDNDDNIDFALQNSTISLEPIDPDLTQRHTDLVDQVQHKEAILADKMKLIQKLLDENCDLELTDQMLRLNIIAEDRRELTLNHNNEQNQGVKPGYPKALINTNLLGGNLNNSNNRSNNTTNKNYRQRNNNNTNPNPPQSIPVKLQKQRLFKSPSLNTTNTTTNNTNNPQSNQQQQQQHQYSTLLFTRPNGFKSQEAKMLCLQEQIFRSRSKLIHLIYKGGMVAHKLQVNTNAFSNMGRMLNQFWGQGNFGGAK